MSDLYQALLGMMASKGRGGDSQAMLTQLLANQEGLDPATQALLSQALAQSATDEDEGADEDDVDDLERDVGQRERRRRAVRTLRRRFAEMQDELDELRDRNDRLAAALGACYRCWGEDQECELCGGKGQPGSMLPDRRLFREMVAPAIQRARAAWPRQQPPVTGKQAPEEGV